MLEIGAQTRFQLFEDKAKGEERMDKSPACTPN
jgi:hypothetical protein